MHIFRTSFPKNTSGKLLLSNNIIGILMSWNWGDLLLKVSIFEHDLTFILTDGMLWRPFRSVYWRSLSLCSEWLWNYFLGYCLIKQWYVVITCPVWSGWDSVPFNRDPGSAINSTQIISHNHMWKASSWQGGIPLLYCRDEIIASARLRGWKSNLTHAYKGKLK